MSSASTIQKFFKYDVFLSFRGEDTRKTFVDHLYFALQHKGVRIFKDVERIDKGEMIHDQHIRSIEESRFYIIVFSKNYASSSWCLEELAKIMECQKTMHRQTAYPVFYDVEPTEVRKQSGAVGEALERLTKKRKRMLKDVHLEKEDDIGRWRNALKEAAGLAGMELKNTIDGHQEKFIQKIVEDVSLKLNLVGMETRVKNIVSTLEIGLDHVRIIGIKGIGGGGKTTLARAIFDHISITFEGKSFVENVRNILRGSFSGLKELQKQVLSDVLNDPNIEVKSVDDGKKMMEEKMHGRKVLLVLDNVDHIDQLEALAGNPTWFKPGSAIIITTRYEQLLKAHQVNFIHDVNLLSDEEAMCLLSRHAFGREIPNQGYEKLSREVVRYAAGVPLTIKVLGSHLFDRTKHEWVDAIERLKIIPKEHALEKLEISYDGLDNDNKEIFLDIACILKGGTTGTTIKILESCGFDAQIGLQVLEEKYFITVSDDDQLLLHDNIEEMGMNIVRRFHPDKPHRHGRLWIKEEIEDILVYDLGSEVTRSIRLLNTDLSPDVIMNGLTKMKELRFLYVDNKYKTDAYASSSSYEYATLPNALRYLYWHSYPLSWLPKTFLASNLVNLEMPHSNLSQLWEGGEIKVLNTLRFLDLSFSRLRSLDLGLTPHLEKLNLASCKGFVELHMPIELLNLQFLNLSSSKLSNILNLELTPNLERLESPEMLTLSHKDIKHLPDSICMLKLLKSLEIKSCLYLEQLPKDLCILECLEKLHLSDCISLQDIPNSICKMKCLRYLHIPYCVQVQKLPDELGNLKSLKELNIEGTGIHHLPQSIFELEGLCIVWSKGQLESNGFTSFEELSRYTAFSYIKNRKTLTT